MKPFSIAIIGAGPSGFYAAEAFIRSGLDSRIDFIEALPNPFGLVRSGVAPDHQHIKGVIRAYERTALDDHVAYYGNVSVGQDINLTTLRRYYDAIVIATGAPLDRSLKIPGGDLPGVYGSSSFVGWYNGHPDHRDLQPLLDHECVCVIGHGNVALDVARVLVKTPEEMAGSDLPDYAAKAIHGSPVRKVFLFGRRGPLEAKFTNTELKELGKLRDCVPCIDRGAIPDELPTEISGRERRVKERNLATLRGFATPQNRKASKELHIVFNANPVAVLGEHRVEALRLERTVVEGGRAVSTGERFECPCGTVVAAIGTRAQPIDGLPFDDKRGVVVNRGGRVAKGLYVVGWAKRGPTGVIGSNKADANALPDLMRADVPEARKPGRAALEEWLDERHVQWVSYEDWKAIEAAEIDAAPEGAPRKKMCRIKDMLAVVAREAAAARS